MALIQVKRKEYITGLDVVDLKDQFQSASCKWRKITKVTTLALGSRPKQGHGKVQIGNATRSHIHIPTLVEISQNVTTPFTTTCDL